jgi:GT2 family glycosyltransferase
METTNPLGAAQLASPPGLAPGIPSRGRGRVRTDGKFLTLDGQSFRVRGATYGSFLRRDDGESFPEQERVLADFAAMAKAGLNTVRTYALPPEDVLDAAEAHGLFLLVGLHYPGWRSEPSAGRRARRRVLDAGRSAVADALERCAGRDCVLALSVGNEVPGDIVRLHGIGAVEETLSSLVEEVHAGGDELLATYTNYPTTEYLHIDGQDLVTFNVFLEQADPFERYLRHLQVVSGELPLVIAELGLASEVHGAEAQADALAWQLRLVEETGCAGATVFSWTDEWAVAGEPVEDWGFGLTDAQRRPRPALDVVRRWSRTGVRDLRTRWPRVSVVVCARNEEQLVERCLRSLLACDYPDLEVIFCDDGSTDSTLELARRFPVGVLALEHGGLSRARNAGIAAATGEIVAFLDADAEAHQDWPYRLVLSLEDGIAATGGPNIPPDGGPFVERAVALSPGGPTHVLVGDDRAEHVPGCNMAFRKEALEAIGGFDPVYRAAGDDVDVCWKLLDRRHEIGFAAAAQVRHHRPSTVGIYLRQQLSYGRAEHMLRARHHHRFNALGQARWAGSIYGGPRVLPGLLRPLVYHGTMGFAPFQTVARRRAERVLSAVSSRLPLAVPVAAVGGLAFLSLWLLLAPALALGAVLGYGVAVAAAVRPARNEPRPLALRLLVGALHVVQPFVRTWSRLRGGGPDHTPEPRPLWSGDRRAWLDSLQRELASHRCRVRVGGPHDPWDLRVTWGPLLSYRVTTAVAWSWSPLERCELRARPAAFALLAAALALVPFSPLGAFLAAAAVGAAAAAEYALLRRAVRGSLRTTTHGSAVLGEP